MVYSAFWRGTGHLEREQSATNNQISGGSILANGKSGHTRPWHSLFALLMTTRASVAAISTMSPWWVSPERRAFP